MSFSPLSWAFLLFVIGSFLLTLAFLLFKRCLFSSQAFLLLIVSSLLLTLIFLLHIMCSLFLAFGIPSSHSGFSPFELPISSKWVLSPCTFFSFSYNGLSSPYTGFPFSHNRLSLPHHGFITAPTDFPFQNDFFPLYTNCPFRFKGFFLFSYFHGIIFFS